MTYQRSPPSAPDDEGEPPSGAKRASMIREWNKGSLRIVQDAQDQVSDERTAGESEDGQPRS